MPDHPVRVHTYTTTQRTWCGERGCHAELERRGRSAGVWGPWMVKGNRPVLALARKSA